MKKLAALTAFLSALQFGLLGLATAVGQTTPTDLLALTIAEQHIPCGAVVSPFNIAIIDIGHQLFCNLTGMEGHAIFAGWSPDGTRVAVEAGGTVYIADSHMREVARFEQSYSPSWSVNGTLVYRNLVGNIFTVDQNGENRRILTSRGIIGEFPRWSPDGARVVFDCEIHICIVDSDGENLRQVTLSNENIELKSTSFDYGENLIIHNSSMYIVDHEGEQMRRIMRDYAIFSEPEFSFDGQQVAFYIGESGGKLGIMIVNTVNGSEKLLFSHMPSSSVRLGWIVWSPDGSQLAFDFNGIRLAVLSTGTVRLVCSDCSNPVWVPDLALAAMIAEP